MGEPRRVRQTRLLGELQSAVAADGGVSLFLDDGDGTLAFVASSRAHGAAPPWHRRLLGRGQADGQVLVVPVPDRRGGVIVLERSSQADFTRDDRALARIYARQLADEICVRGPQPQTVYTRQLEAVQRIAAQLTRLASVEQVGLAVCSETRRVMDYDEIHVLLVGETGYPRPVATASGPLATAGAPELAMDSRAGHAISRVIASGAPLLVPAATDPAPGRPGSWSLLIVPMRYDRRVSGVLCLLREGTARFDDDDTRLLQILSDQAAVAIENAKLLAGRDELVRGMNALLDVSTAANQPTDEGSLAANLAVRMRRTSRADGCVIWRLDQGSTVLRLLSCDGTAAPATADLAELAAQQAVLREGRPSVAWTPARGRDGPTQDRRTDVLLPLTVAGRSIGIVELSWLGVAHEFGEAEMQAYQTMASSIASGLENVRLLEELRLAADVDQLTGVNNHRYLQERLRQEVARAARTHSSLVVLMIDLDDFKPINDRYGHATGDRVLASVAASIRSEVRLNDVVARYGGDEFVVLMPDTAVGPGEEVARRVVSGIIGRRYELGNGGSVRVGASAGMALYPEDGHTAVALLAAADAAMYANKRGQQAGVGHWPAGAMKQPLVAPAS